MIYKLEDIADVTMGQSPKSEYYNFEGIGMLSDGTLWEASNAF